MQADSKLPLPSPIHLPKVSLLTPRLHLGDPMVNAAVIREQAALLDADFVVTPELSLTGYTCQDLFFQQGLLDQTFAALKFLRDSFIRTGQVLIVGMPLRVGDRLYNCAVAILGTGNGCNRILGLVPKTFLPNYGEFYDQRWFSGGRELTQNLVTLLGEQVAFTPGLLFEDTVNRLTWGIEICEDLWAVTPPSNDMALAGAHLIFNLSASNELVSKAAYRRELVKSQSGRLLCAYAYVGAGPWESASDTVFSGHGIIAENDSILAESPRFCFGHTVTSAHIDLAQIRAERLRNTTFAEQMPRERAVRIAYRRHENAYAVPVDAKLIRPISASPFVPADPVNRAIVCEEIVTIQCAALERRLRQIGGGKRPVNVIIGVSGGLDSTLALLDAVRTVDRMGQSRKTIHGITMPGAGTTGRTLANALLLMESLGITYVTIQIAPQAAQMLSDIQHTGVDVTFENAYARARYETLFTYANKHGGIVLGTGDLSEIALGWMTYNGDSESHFGINAGVPKTLIKALVEWLASTPELADAAPCIRDILQTPISPELLPTAQGQLVQKTEDVLGPYAAHDFFLYWAVRKAVPAAQVLRYALQAFDGVYTRDELTTWLSGFYSRFTGSQFKRNSMPDGLKVGTLSLSQRTDWRMPSDMGSQWTGFPRTNT